MSKPARAQIGIRELEDIKADPRATPEEIKHLSEQYAVWGLEHVNCPPDLWWRLAAMCPIEARASVLFDILTLEEPGHWDDLTSNYVETWLVKYIDELPEVSRRLFAADCVERILPIWESLLPGNKLLQQAITAARAYAKKKITKQAMYQVRTALEDALENDNDVVDDAAVAVEAAIAATSGTREIYHVFARRAADEAVKVVSWENYEGEWGQERKWQWERVLHYWPKAHSVGNRSRKSIQDDPQATAEEVKSLVEAGPKGIIAALNHPNCPPELWWILAVEYPLEAEASMLFAMMTLEAPDRWAELMRTRKLRWVGMYARRLTTQAQRLFGADCAEHVLLAWEDAYPKDHRPRKAIDAARLYAHGQVTARKLASAHAAATRASKEVKYIHRSHHAAMAASDASKLTEPFEAIYAARHATASEDAEVDWQWKKVQEYVRGKVQP